MLHLLRKTLADKTLSLMRLTRHRLASGLVYVGEVVSLVNGVPHATLASMMAAIEPLNRRSY